MLSMDAGMKTRIKTGVQSFIFDKNTNTYLACLACYVDIAQQFATVSLSQLVFILVIGL